MKVLVVEDHSINRLLICAMLHRSGYETIEATDGTSGVTLASRHNPDLILMDIGLPDISGYEATKLIKSNPTTSHIPIVAVTAHAFASDKIQALSAGCSYFLSKPILIRDLETAIHEVTVLPALVSVPEVILGQ
jgi:two-component system, cell cycle response regulator DivK